MTIAIQQKISVCGRVSTSFRMGEGPGEMGVRIRVRVRELHPVYNVISGMLKLKSIHILNLVVQAYQIIFHISKLSCLNFIHRNKKVNILRHQSD